jgi:thiamine pyrophosphate-dependent acetolactate synthase large subunit-like protein
MEGGLMGMTNHQAVEAIENCRENSIVVSTMSPITAIMELSESSLNLRVAPMMGAAGSIGLGIALARPDKKVIILDGDGCLLMQLGSLATNAGAAPDNFYHFVFNNGVLYETGTRLPIANGKAVDFEGLGRAAGYAAAYSIDSVEALKHSLPDVLSGPAPALISLDIDLPEEVWSNQNFQGEMPDWWFSMMGEDGLRIKNELASLNGTKDF